MMTIRICYILFLFQLLSIELVAQKKVYISDPSTDHKQEALLEAERLRSILWDLVIRIEDIGDMTTSTTLDSLYHCCIAGKTGDSSYEKKLAADILFFNGCKLTHIAPETAKPIIESAIRQFRQLEDSTKTVIGYMQLIWTLSNLGDSTGFAIVRNQVVKLMPSLTDPYIMTNLQSTLGVGCYDYGMYAEAASHYFEALRIVDSVRSPELLSAKRDMFHNLGGVYARLGDLNTALLYIRRAIESAKETGQDTLDHYLILARVLISKKDFKEALHALKQTQDFEFVQANSIGMGQNAFSQATCYRQLGQLDSALWYAQKSVRLLPVSINAQNGAAALLELATCEFALGMDSALIHADTALAILERTKYTAGMVEATALLSDIYKSKGEYLRALEYSELRFTYQNQIERLQSNRQLAFGEFTRENASKLARREAEIKAELDRQRNIRLALYAGIGLFALIAFLLYNRYRFKQRTTLQLESKNVEIEAARIRAEQSEAFKTRFLANMSHEIRTPLHGISGFADLLQDTSLTEKQRRWLGAIHQSAFRLKDVVNDILDLSKLEAGEVKLRKVAFSPLQVVRDIAESIHPGIIEKGITLEVAVDPDSPDVVIGDPTRLYQVLINLAGNAAKFTKEGKITISMLRQTNDVPGMVSVLFSVKDTGIGIPCERLSAVFDVFQQADESTTATFGGTGLGLTIARDLVRLHGSDITVKSSVGEGSEFMFSITWPLANTEQLELLDDSMPGMFTQPLHVLVVDDNEFNLEISEEAIFRYFKNAKVDLATNGRQAVEKVSLEIYDIVLMDLQMPELNGMDATRMIRNGGGKNSQVPVIALSASATQVDVRGALEAGMNYHLGKPFQPHELATLIANVLQLASEGNTIQATQVVVDNQSYAVANGRSMELQFLRDFCNGDEAQVRYFLGKFERQMPVEMERLSMAIEKNDRELTFRIAHSFRPQVAFVGLNEEAGILLAIELGAREGDSFHDLKTHFELLDNRLSIYFNG